MLVKRAGLRVIKVDELLGEPFEIMNTKQFPLGIESCSLDSYCASDPPLPCHGGRNQMEPSKQETSVFTRVSCLHNPFLPTLAKTSLVVVFSEVRIDWFSWSSGRDDIAEITA